MLTATQQKILDDLKIEFGRTNIQTEQSIGGLINKAAIDKKFNESNIIKANIDSLNSATDKIIRDMVNHDMDRLNKDLNDMGMWATHHYSNGYSIGIAPYGIDSCRDNGLIIEYSKKHNTEILPDGVAYTAYTGFRKIVWGTQEFDTIDELARNDYFIGRVERLYKKILNSKK